MRPQHGRQLGGQSLVVRRLGQLRPDDLVVVDLLPLDAPERALEDVHGAVRADEQPALVRRLRVLAALAVAPADSLGGCVLAEWLLCVAFYWCWGAIIFRPRARA